MTRIPMDTWKFFFVEWNNRSAAKIMQITTKSWMCLELTLDFVPDQRMATVRKKCMKGTQYIKVLIEY